MYAIRSYYGLGLKGQGSKGYDGKYYGWSHRAVYGFGRNNFV